MDPVCARCATSLGSCCQVKPGEPLATLTLADVARICAYLQQPASSFLEEEWLSLEEARAYEEHRPLFAGYFRHGPRRLTLKVKSGACVLLHPASGCRLDPVHRPIACRLYPLEPWPDGSLSVLAGRRPEEPACLAVEESASFEELLRSLCLSSGQVEELAWTLRSDVRDHSRAQAPGCWVP